MKKIDLHVHTNISDGSEPPESTVAHAKELGMAAIAITDHDSTGAVKAAQAAGEKYGIEVVAGMELGCGWYGREVHMLAYDIDPDSPQLKPTLDWIVQDRDERNRKMADLFARDGIKIDLDEMKERHPNSIIGRPHFALCLIEAGLAESVQDAFKRLLDPGCKYYIRRNFLTVEQAAELIRKAGGKAVIAHPRQYKLSEDGLEELLQRAENAGVSGLECYYSGYSEEESAEYLRLAKLHGLCPTVGSDWHGRHKPHIEMGYGISGELHGEYELLENLRNHI